MFPLVHIYVATQVVNKKSPLLVFGSVLPDLVWLDRDKFPIEKLHDDLDGFYKFVEDNHQEYLDLSLGMKLHSNKDGADKYSHFYNGGYAYVKGEEIKDAVKALVETADDKKALGLSHTFIEASLDLLLAKKFPDIVVLYKKTLKEIDFLEISLIISEFSGVNKEIVLKTIQKFMLFSPENLSSERAMASKILPKMIDFGFKKRVSSVEIEKVINNANRVIEKEFEDFFKEMIFEMKKDFSVNK